MALLTAQQIADRACNELGLPTGSIDPSLSDQIGTQLLSLMNSLGDDLVRVHDWQFLEKVATITGDGVATSFALPADYGRTVNQTAWSTSERLPAIGPVSAATWGWLNYGIVSTSVYFRYRIINDEFSLFPTPGSGEIFNFYYITKNWVLDNDGVTYKDVVETPEDTPLFDRALMIAGLKLRLWAQKGLDTTHLAEAFNYNLEALKGQSQGAAVIDLSGSDLSILIDPLKNVPEGSW